MLLGIDAQFSQAVQVQLLNIVRRWFENDLVLIIMLHPVWIFAVASVRGPSTGLRIGCPPWLRTQRSEKGSRMKCSCSHFQVIRLLDDAALISPKTMEGEDEILIVQEMSCRGGAVRDRWSTLRLAESKLASLLLHCQARFPLGSRSCKRRNGAASCDADRHQVDGLMTTILMFSQVSLLD